MIDCDLNSQITASTVKIGDFGLSFAFTSPLISKATSKCGTKTYMSPEQLLGNSYGKVGTY